MGRCLVLRLRGIWVRTVEADSHHHNLQIGYARISSKKQRADMQVHALGRAGCDLIYIDTIPGDELWRRGLRLALYNCREGDVLMVWKIDRLSRKLIDVLGIAELLRMKGTTLHLLEGCAEPINAASPEHRLIFSILGCFAEFEHELIGVRTRVGRAASKEASTLRGFIEDRT